LTYIGLRQFPAALKLCDRVLDIKPNDPDVMAMKARIYQALGNLEEAARFLSGINETSSAVAFETKTTQLEFERNYAELLQLQQARAAREGSVGGDQLNLAIYQWMAGDTAGARVTAEKARNTLEQSSREERRDVYLATLTGGLSQVYALLGEKDSALKLAERAIMLYSRGGTEFVSQAPTFKENLAWIQMMSGENSRAISTLTHLLQTPYNSNCYGPSPVTRARLRLDPLWDPLRADPAFQKLCEEKQQP
jgi:tetratricopeptide (TPR) repeat protein